MSLGKKCLHKIRRKNGEKSIKENCPRKTRKVQKEFRLFILPNGVVYVSIAQFAREQSTQALTVLDIKDTVQPGPAHVCVDDENLRARLGKADRGVGSGRGLAL